MKIREQRPSEFSLQGHHASTPDSEASVPEEDGTSPCCHIEDANTKFGTLFFGLLLMTAGAALLYLGFRPNPDMPAVGKNASDNKILLTCGFISTLLGLFCFVISILMFKNVPCLYNDNLYQVDDEV